jgi:CheY-like chemotaxis protein
MMQANSSSWHKPKSVMIVDDHPIVRRGVRALLECGTNFAVVGEAENGAQAVELALEIGPDIIVIDLSMPHLGGIEAIAELRREFPAMEILVFTLHRSDQLFAEALAAGRGPMSASRRPNTSSPRSTPSPAASPTSPPASTSASRTPTTKSGTAAR